MKTADFHYEIPDALVAQQPQDIRDASRLLVYDRASRLAQDCAFCDLPALVRMLKEKSGARRILFIANDSRVYPARVRIRRATGARGEVFVLRPQGDGPWDCLLRPLKKLRLGEVLLADGAGEPLFRVESLAPPRVVLVDPSADMQSVLARHGEMPLPPYIDRDPGRGGAQTLTMETMASRRRLDGERYQTVYAGTDAGSAAAPTAGLHFTPALMDECRAAGAQFAFVTLHVGLGTFAPVQTEELEDHPMHEEWVCVPASLAASLEEERAARARGEQPSDLIIFVGTTALRAVESFCRAGDAAKPGVWFPTRLFLRPSAGDGTQTRVTPVLGDALITNFHQPQSTLVMLIAALIGADAWRPLYEHAIAERYRFFSYGDASLLLFTDAVSGIGPLESVSSKTLPAHPTNTGPQ